MQNIHLNIKMKIQAEKQRTYHMRKWSITRLHRKDGNCSSFSPDFTLLTYILYMFGNRMFLWLNIMTLYGVTFMKKANVLLLVNMYVPMINYVLACTNVILQHGSLYSQISRQILIVGLEISKIITTLFNRRFFFL